MAQSRCYQILSSLLTCIALLATRISSLDKPNILFILADDLGWNDICFHGSCGFSTPNIDNLAINYGLQLNNYYVHSSCTPTRAAFLTGRYNIHTGMHHSQLSPFETYGLPLDFTLLSDDLQSAGYDTYLFGKWHLGYFNEEYTPTFRGFNTFFGFYNGFGDFWNHTVTVNYRGIIYERYDLMDNTEPAQGPELHTYSTFNYGNKTIDVLDRYYDDNSTEKQPFFIYLSLQNVHLPLQAPQYVIDSINIDDENRKIKAAMATVVDTMIGDIVEVLNDTGLWENLLLIFSTDNGAASNDGGSNYPLRGTKGTLWEGAVRGAAFISGGYLNASRYGQVTNELLHITDFYPTICDIVDINPSDAEDLDGISFFNVLQNEEGKSERDEVLLNMDPVDCDNAWNVCGGIRFGDWKLLVGNIGNQVCQISEPRSAADLCVAGWCTNTDFDYYDSTTPTVKCIVNNATKQWNITNIYNECPFNGEPCLFNIKNDPCEFYDVSGNNTDIVDYGMERLNYWKTQLVTPLNVLNDHIDPGDIPQNDYWISWKNTSDIVMWDTNAPTSPPVTQVPTSSPVISSTEQVVSTIFVTITTEDADEYSKKSNIGTMIGYIFLAAVVVAGVIFTIVVVCRRKQREKRRQKPVASPKAEVIPLTRVIKESNVTATAEQ